MTLVSTTLPRSILVFSGGYHAISITSLVNNYIITFLGITDMLETNQTDMKCQALFW